MIYTHYLSVEVLESIAGFGINFHFGSPTFNVDTEEYDEFWGVKIMFIIFDLRLGIITSIEE